MSGRYCDPSNGARRLGKARAALVLVALVGMLGACSSDDDSDDVEDDSTTATEVTDAVDDAVAAADDTVADADAQTIANLESELATTQTSLDEAEATVAQQETMINDLTAEHDGLQTTNADLAAQLQAETTRANEAQAQVDAFDAAFPVTVTSSLDGYNLVGAYTLTMTEAYCDGLPTCGTPRPAVRADIIPGPNGLQLQVPTVLTTGLFAVEGSLFAVTDSNLILPQCAGAPRVLGCRSRSLPMASQLPATAHGRCPAWARACSCRHRPSAAARPASCSLPPNLRPSDPYSGEVISLNVQRSVGTFCIQMLSSLPTNSPHGAHST